MQPQNRLVESIFCLYHIVVQRCMVGVKRNSQAELRMSYGGKLRCEFRPCESSSIGEHVDVSVRQAAAEFLNNIEELVTQERGFAASNAKIFGCRRQEVNQLKVP